MYIWSNLKGSTSTLNKHFNSVHGVTRKRRLSNGDQPTLDFLNSKKRKYMNITDKAGFEAALVNFIISKGLPASIFNGSAFSEVVRSLRYELKLPGTNKLHDIIKTEYA
ncbi:hypothetical protein C6P40_005518 [Pichia californica]|uniref:Uncharacterized protein n=1 Tax=Pichia californica TaxID=460514 RepID=A0A9P6WFB6_9ASCO|nr:hypothetical protein C6P42_005158 [[Candida] californica]KAG0680739.1 hypothetical protein C6P40_005518 [[Candida] californica]